MEADAPEASRMEPQSMVLTPIARGILLNAPHDFRFSPDRIPSPRGVFPMSNRTPVSSGTIVEVHDYGVCRFGTVTRASAIDDCGDGEAESQLCSILPDEKSEVLWVISNRRDGSKAVSPALNPKSHLLITLK